MLPAAEKPRSVKNQIPVKGSYNLCIFGLGARELAALIRMSGLIASRTPCSALPSRRHRRQLHPIPRLPWPVKPASQFTGPYRPSARRACPAPPPPHSSALPCRHHSATPPRLEAAIHRRRLRPGWVCSARPAADRFLATICPSASLPAD